MTTQPAVPVTFLWRSVQPDKRQWKPSSPLLEPVDMYVEVNVPLKHDYVSNAQVIIQAQLGATDVPKPRLTPAGMRYCIDQLEKVMSDVSHAPVEVEFSDDEEWETTVEPETSNDEDWEDTSTDDEAFEDNDEEWENG